MQRQNDWTVSLRSDFLQQLQYLRRWNVPENLPHNVRSLQNWHQQNAKRLQLQPGQNIFYKHKRKTWRAKNSIWFLFKIRLCSKIFSCNSSGYWPPDFERNPWAVFFLKGFSDCPDFLRFCRWQKDKSSFKISWIKEDKNCRSQYFRHNRRFSGIFVGSFSEEAIFVR